MVTAVVYSEHADAVGISALVVLLLATGIVLTWASLRDRWRRRRP